jgi:hypothetical protein
VKHTTNQQTRAGRGPARGIGRTLALVLPGTLAVTRVNWSGESADPVLAAANAEAPAGVAAESRPAPQDVLRDRLLTELQEKDPGVALTHLQRAVDERPSLARHCASLARALGRAAVRIYGPVEAQSYSRPVCDTSFATGVAAAGS